MKILVLALLIVLYLLSLIVNQALRRLPANELRWRSRSGQDHQAAAILKLSQYGAFAFSVVWLIGMAGLIGLAWKAFSYSWWGGGLLLLVSGAIAVLWQPIKQTDGWSWRLAGWLADNLSKLFSYVRPVADSFNELAAGWTRQHPPQQLFIKDDLLALLKRQDNQTGNRISADDLQRAATALRFSDQTVAEIMIPSKSIKWVETAEAIGPSLMDELHKSNQQRFPVVTKISKSAQPEILGTLYIGQLLDHLADQGKVRDLMAAGATYINEASGLEQALNVFLKSGSSLLVAVNDRADVAGILPIEKLLEAGLAKTSDDDWRGFDDPRKAADYAPSSDKN